MMRPSAVTFSLVVWALTAYPILTVKACLLTADVVLASFVVMTQALFWCFPRTGE